MEDDTEDMVLEQLRADRPEIIEACEAELTRELAGLLSKGETCEQRRTRITREIEDIAASRVIAILLACRDAGKLDMAPRFVRSGKSALMVEYDLAKMAGRIH